MKISTTLIILLFSIKMQAQSVGIGSTQFVPLQTLEVRGDITIDNLTADAAFRIANTKILHNKGTGNLFVGNDAGKVNTGSTSTFSGYRAGYNNAAGNNNSFFGYLSGYSNTTGYSNVAIGSKAMYSAALIYNTVAIGDSAFYWGANGNTDPFQTMENTAVGSKALYSNVTGSFNSAFGYKALYSNNGGTANSAFGNKALYSNTTGTGNIATGWRSLYLNNTGTGNCAYGTQALQGNSSGTFNIAIGTGAMISNTNGSHNIAIGNQSLYSNSSGNENISIGRNSLFSIAGNYNIGVGSHVMYSSTGNNNSVIGHHASEFSGAGSDNCIMGYYAGNSGGGWIYNQCVIIGANSFTTTSRTNVVMLGYGITNAECTGDNQVCIGNTAVTQVRAAAAVTGFTAYSDKRIKTNINYNVLGLDFILKLKPATYNVQPRELHRIWGSRDSIINKINFSQAEKAMCIGFLAQDVEIAAKECGFDFPGIDIPKNNSEVYTLRYVDFIMPVVKAIQEQQQQINNYKSRIEALELQLLSINLHLKKIEVLEKEIFELKKYMK